MTVWENVYAAAQDIWIRPVPALARNQAADRRPLEGYDLHDAQKTADSVERGFRNLPRGLSRTPDPGNCFRCGTFTGVDWATQLGIVRDTWTVRDKIDMLWSEDLQAIFVFPHLPKSACNKIPPLREGRLSRTWAEGRKAKCARSVTFPSVSLTRVAPAVAVSYHSDKFRTRGRHTFQNYIHHFGPGVFLYSSALRKGGPTVLMMRGGRLRLTTHGIAG